MKSKFILAVVTTILFSCSQAVIATEVPETKPSIVEETFIPIENHTFDEKGYLNMRALPPIGFAGAVCVDIKNLDTGEVQTEKLGYMDSYIGGVWLAEGRYEILNPRPESGNFFLVESSASVVEILHDKKASIEFVIRPNPETMAQFEQAHADFKEQQGSIEASSESMPATQPPTAPTADVPATELMKEPVQTVPVNETEPILSDTSDENTKESRNVVSDLIITLVAVVVFVGIILVGTWIVKKKYE